MRSIDDNNNKLYVKIIDYFYVVVHARRVMCNVVVSYFKIN